MKIVEESMQINLKSRNSSEILKNFPQEMEISYENEFRNRHNGHTLSIPNLVAKHAENLPSSFMDNQDNNNEKRIIQGKF